MQWRVHSEILSHVLYKWNIFLNRYIFRFFFSKTVLALLSHRHLGKEFHNVGAAQLNDLEANVSFWILGVWRSLPDDQDLSDLLGAWFSFMSSWMYLGAFPLSDLCVITSILYWIHCSIWSQCSCFRHSVELSYLCLLRTNFVHIFWIL